MRHALQTAYAEVKADPASLAAHLDLGMGYMLGAGFYGVVAALIVAHETLLPERELPQAITELLAERAP